MATGGSLGSSWAQDYRPLAATTPSGRDMRSNQPTNMNNGAQRYNQRAKQWMGIQTPRTTKTRTRGRANGQAVALPADAALHVGPGLGLESVDRKRRADSVTHRHRPYRMERCIDRPSDDAECRRWKVGTWAVIKNRSMANVAGISYAKGKSGKGEKYCHPMMDDKSGWRWPGHAILTAMFGGKAPPRPREAICSSERPTAEGKWCRFNGHVDLWLKSSYYEGFCLPPSHPRVRSYNRFIAATRSVEAAAQQ